MHMCPEEETAGRGEKGCIVHHHYTPKEKKRKKDTPRVINSGQQWIINLLQWNTEKFYRVKVPRRSVVKNLFSFALMYTYYTCRYTGFTPRRIVNNGVPLRTVCFPDFFFENFV